MFYGGNVCLDLGGFFFFWRGGGFLGGVFGCLFGFELLSVLFCFFPSTRCIKELQISSTDHLGLLCANCPGLLNLNGP